MKERSSRPRPGWWIRSCYMDAAGWHGNFKCKTHYDDVKGPCPAPTRCSCTIPCKEQAGNREAAPAFISHSRRLVFRPDQARQYARTQYARLASFRQNARRPLSLMLRSIAARRERRRFRSPNALRCVPIFRDARTRVRICGTSSASALLRMDAEAEKPEIRRRIFRRTYALWCASHIFVCCSENAAVSGGFSEIRRWTSTRTVPLPEQPSHPEPAAATPGIIRCKPTH